MRFVAKQHILQFTIPGNGVAIREGRQAKMAIRLIPFPWKSMPKFVLLFSCSLVLVLQKGLVLNRTDSISPADGFLIRRVLPRPRGSSLHLLCNPNVEVAERCKKQHPSIILGVSLRLFKHRVSRVHGDLPCTRQHQRCNSLRRSPRVSAM